LYGAEHLLREPLCPRPSRLRRNTITTHPNTENGPQTLSVMLTAAMCVDGHSGDPEGESSVVHMRITVEESGRMRAWRYVLPATSWSTYWQHLGDWCTQIAESEDAYTSWSKSAPKGLLSE
jgi:hypothetical protein